MDKKLENAHNLYLRGIRDGEITEVLTQYMGETYTQHSTCLLYTSDAADD